MLKLRTLKWKSEAVCLSNEQISKILRTKSVNSSDIKRLKHYARKIQFYPQQTTITMTGGLGNCSRITNINTASFQNFQNRHVKFNFENNSFERGQNFKLCFYRDESLRENNFFAAKTDSRIAVIWEGFSR